MMASGYEVVDVVRYEDQEVSQEGVASEWKTVRAVFPNFAELPSGRGDCTDSPVLKCHGLEWVIEFYPGGHKDSRGGSAYISLQLRCVSCTTTNKIIAKARFRIPSAGNTKGGWDFFVFSPKDIYGYLNYAKREKVLDSLNDYLVDGNLTVEVDIQVMIDKPLKPPVWTPTNTLSLDMLKILDSDNLDDFDINFNVGTDEPEQIAAHRAILKARAPVLADIVADFSGSGCSIPINDVEPDMFRVLLRYLYGGEVPSKEIMDKSARVIIRVSNKYGCAGLKLAAEAEMAAAGITSENAADIFLFADATNCAMLKEAAMDHFVIYAQDVMASEGFALVKESPAVLIELMAAMASGSKKRPASSDADSKRDYKRMRVATLRYKLDEKKIDVDGSKEMLISRLEAAEVEARVQAEAEARAQAEAEAETQAQAEAENDDEDE